MESGLVDSTANKKDCRLRGAPANHLQNEKKRWRIREGTCSFHCKREVRHTRIGLDTLVCINPLCPDVVKFAPIGWLFLCFEPWFGACKKRGDRKIKELSGITPLSSCALASKTENKPLCSSRASYVDHGFRGQTVRDDRCSTNDMHCVRWPTGWWWDVLQRTTDAAITRSHRHLVIAISDLLYPRDLHLIYMLDNALGIEVHRAIALPKIGVTRIRFTPNPEPDRGLCALGKTCAAEDDLLRVRGAGGTRSRGLGNRYR